MKKIQILLIGQNVRFTWCPTGLMRWSLYFCIDPAGYKCTSP